MSQNNAKDELTAIAIVVSFISAMMMFMVVIAFAILAFVALVLTGVALFAWTSPLTLGTWTLMPHEARAFVYRGLIGAVLAAALSVFMAILFKFWIEDQAVPYILLIGYTLGSIGVEIMNAQNASDAPGQTALPPEQHIAPPPHTYQPPAKPFRFASWDDEDGR
ncbi:MAG: hypothetical protein DI527_20925 [Chelatococcus sp.]|nr:MAG: hypothetical protein DI527_20925 [Chelatococcus sp.]